MPTGGWGEFWEGAAAFSTSVGPWLFGGILVTIVLYKFMEALTARWRGRR